MQRMLDVVHGSELAGPSTIRELARCVQRTTCGIGEQGDLFVPRFHVGMIAGDVFQRRKSSAKRLERFRARHSSGQ